MKILIFNFEYPPLGGGGGVATQQLSEALASRHTVHVVTTHFATLPRYEMRNGVHVHRVPVWGRKERETASLRSLLSFVAPALRCGRRLCRAEKFNVINAQFVVPSGIVAALLARRFHIPLVVSFIGGDVYDPSKRMSPHRLAPVRWLIRWVAKQAVAATAISEDTKERAVTLHKVSTDITVVPLGFVRRPTAPISRDALRLPKDAFIFVSIGRLIPRKGFERLLRLWSQVPERASLVIIGAGPLDAALQQEARAMGVTSRVLFTGHVSDQRKMQILSVADAYVSAAVHEGFGLVFLEAMAAGLPIVATTNGGQVDFLTAPANALLVDPQSDTALLAAIKNIMADDAQRAQMRRNNIASVRAYAVDKTAAQFEAVLALAVQRYSQIHHKYENRH